MQDDKLFLTTIMGRDMLARDVMYDRMSCIVIREDSECLVYGEAFLGQYRERLSWIICQEMKQVV